MLDRAYAVYTRLVSLLVSLQDEPVGHFKKLLLSIEMRALFAEVNLFVEFMNNYDRGSSAKEVFNLAAMSVQTNNCVMVVNLLQSTKFFKDDELKIIKTFSEKMYEHPKGLTLTCVIP